MDYEVINIRCTAKCCECQKNRTIIAEDKVSAIDFMEKLGWEIDLFTHREKCPRCKKKIKNIPAVVVFR